MSLGAGSRLCLKNLGLQRTLGPSPTGQPGMANKPALQHPGCRDPTQSVLSLALPRQVATHGGGVPKALAKKASRQGPHRMVAAAKGGEEVGRRQPPLLHSWMGSPKHLSFQYREVPQADTGHFRAGQGQPGSQLGSRGSLMTAVFCCRFPSCSRLRGAAGARRREG